MRECYDQYFNECGIDWITPDCVRCALLSRLHLLAVLQRQVQQGVTHQLVKENMEQENKECKQEPYAEMIDKPKLRSEICRPKGAANLKGYHPHFFSDNQKSEDDGECPLSPLNLRTTAVPQ